MKRNCENSKIVVFIVFIGIKVFAIIAMKKCSLASDFEIAPETSFAIIRFNNKN